MHSRRFDQVERFNEVQAELEGGRWSYEQAEALIELIRQGTAHLPPPADRGGVKTRKGAAG